MHKIAFIVLFVLGIFLPDVVLAQYNGYKDWNVYERGLGGKTLLTDECSALAERVLALQLSSGAWPKNIYYPQLTDADVAKLKKDQGDVSVGTIENRATLTEIHFLSNMFQATAQRKYRRAAEKALDYLLSSQYETGAWPLNAYATDPQLLSSTFAGGAMVQVLQFLGEIMAKKEPYTYLSEDTRRRVQEAFNKGIVFILQSQVRLNDQPAGWCAYYAAQDILPDSDPVCRHLSMNSVESASIALLLMSIQNPDEYIQQAVEGVVAWFRQSMIEGQKRENFINKSGKRDFRLVADRLAPGMWCRDYSLELNTPLYTEADGSTKPSVEELSYERRIGISWFTNEPQKVLRRYEKWKNNLLST